MDGRARSSMRRNASAWLAAWACACAAGLAFAQAGDDLPSRVGRIADLAGEVFVAPGDRASEWSPAELNFPVTTGDNLWVGGDGRLELDVGAGQVRFGTASNVHLSRLDDRTIAFFLAQGRAIVRLRVLDPGEVARVDTPNTQLTFTRPGLYRIDVSPDRERTTVVVREGEALLPVPGGWQQVLPGQTAWADGLDQPRVDVRNGYATDGFDSWSANRDRRYDRGRSYAYVSPQMIGAADLDEWGRWEHDATYGAIWYPTAVDSGWAPFRDGQWVWVGGWGWTWVDAQPWGFAPSHYGRWVHVRGRWAWCPGAPVVRPVWSPAMVAWVGGSGWAFSVSSGGPVWGWVPLGWGEPFRPWWNGCSNRCWERYNQPYAVDVRYQRPGVQPERYVNMRVPGAVSAVGGASLVRGQSQRGRHVAVPADQVAGAPMTVSAPTYSRPASRSPAATKPRIDGTPLPAPVVAPAASRPAIAAPSAGPNGAVGGSKPGYAAPGSSALPGGSQRPASADRPIYTAPVQREATRPFAPPASPQAATPIASPPPTGSVGGKPAPAPQRSERAALPPAYVPQPAAVPQPVPAAVPRPGPATVPPVQATIAPAAPAQAAPAAQAVARPAPAPVRGDDRRGGDDKPGAGGGGRGDGGRSDGARGYDKPGRDR